MDKLSALAAETVESRSLIQAVLSRPRTAVNDSLSKVKVKPVLLKQGLKFQFTYYYGQKVRHENVAPENTAERIADMLRAQFRQGLLQTAEADYHILVSKNGEATILKKRPTRAEAELAHNRKKNHVLEEGTPVPFLVELGVMNKQGKVLAAKYDKFRQINRFLEMINDIVPHLPTDRPVSVVDFGCGKSYLTFALHELLKTRHGLDVNIVGVDLKEDVIAQCNALAGKLGCDTLRFQVGDIAGFEPEGRIDMVVALHACDTATDVALEKAVRWGADVILAAPCCQHELYGQLDARGALSPMLKHGIVKERFAALATDAARAQLLELVGYRTQIVEFVELEHTPKNLLIRAVRQRGGNAHTEKLAESYRNFTALLGIRPYLEKALADRLAPLLGQ